MCDYIKNHSEDYELEEIIRPTRTRSESSFSKGHIIDWIKEYVHLLWTGIQERLKYFDKDGTTCWSEAPAEGVFSILGYIVEQRASLTVNHMTKLCRVVKEGPPPGTKKASDLAKRAMCKWPSLHGSRFTTNSYMHGITSSTVSTAMNK